MGQIVLSRYLENVKYGTSWFWRGEVAYDCAEGAAVSFCNSLRGLPYPTGGTDAVCIRARPVFDYGGVKGKTAVVAYFESPGLTQSPLQVGKACVRIVSKADMRKLLTEPFADGKTIEGPDSDGKIWSVVAGSNQVNDFESVIQVQTAYQMASFQASTYLALKRKVNAQPLTLVGFGTVAAESLYLLSVEVDAEFGAALVSVTYLFAWSGSGETFNQRCRSAPGTWFTIQSLVFDDNGQPVLDGSGVQLKRERMVFYAGKKLVGGAIVDAASESRRLFNTGDFSVLEGLTQW